MPPLHVSPPTRNRKPGNRSHVFKKRSIEHHAGQKNEFITLLRKNRLGIRNGAPKTIIATFRIARLTLLENFGWLDGWLVSRPTVTRVTSDLSECTELQKNQKMKRNANKKQAEK